jgi:hypothetical protein
MAGTTPWRAFLAFRNGPRFFDALKVIASNKA